MICHVCFGGRPRPAVDLKSADDDLIKGVRGFFIFNNRIERSISEAGTTTSKKQQNYWNCTNFR